MQAIAADGQSRPHRRPRRAMGAASPTSRCGCAIHRCSRIPDSGRVEEPAAVVEVETRWDPPRSPFRWAWSMITRVADAELMASNAGPVPVVPSGYEASWRVVVRVPRTGVKVASSKWRRDWSEVERLQRHWTPQVQGLSEAEVLRRAGEWHNA